MAKRYNKEGKRSLRCSRKRPSVSIHLNESSTHDCSPVGSSPISVACTCACRSKLSKLLSAPMLDESTNDGIDITWEDQSRELCICQRGKPNDRVEEILSSLPSVDSPVSKQSRLSLGSLTGVGTDKKIRLRKKGQKRDLEGLKILTNMLEAVKSPVHRDENNMHHKENCLKGPLENVSRPCKGATGPSENVIRPSESLIGLNKDPINKMSTDEVLYENAGDGSLVEGLPDTPQQDICQDSENILDQLFTDIDFLDDFSPLACDDATKDNNETETNKQIKDDKAQEPHPSAVRTPFRKSKAVRKTLLCSEGNRGIPKALMDQASPTSHHSSSDDEDCFWTQVAGIMDGVPVVSTDDLNTFENLDEAVVNELFEFEEDELGLLSEKTKDSNSQPQPRVYSQQDIERKRLNAKRKLQQKFKTI